MTDVEVSQAYWARMADLPALPVVHLPDLYETYPVQASTWRVRHYVCNTTSLMDATRALLNDLYVVFVDW